MAIILPLFAFQWLIAITPDLITGNSRRLRPLLPDHRPVPQRHLKPIRLQQCRIIKVRPQLARHREPCVPIGALAGHDGRAIAPSGRRSGPSSTPYAPHRYGFSRIPAPPAPLLVLLSRYPCRLGDPLEHPAHLGEPYFGDVLVLHAQRLQDRSPAGRIGGDLVLQGGKGGLDVALALLPGGDGDLVPVMRSSASSGAPLRPMV
jgi:hypothetical protein